MFDQKNPSRFGPHSYVAAASKCSLFSLMGPRSIFANLRYLVVQESPGAGLNDASCPTSSDHREFLVSFEHGKPDWDLLGLPNAADLPAVRWRQQNLDKLSPTKRAALVTRLQEVLSDGT